MVDYTEPGGSGSGRPRDQLSVTAEGKRVLAALVAVALAIVPGALLGFAVAPGLLRWVTWSVAPVLSLGLTAVAMAWLPALGLSRTVDAALVAEVVLAGLLVTACAIVAHRRAAYRGRSWWSVRPGRPRLVDAVSVGIPSAVCATFGLTFFGSFSQPPGWDAMYHGMLTRTMLDKGTTVASAVCTTGSTQPAEACRFYPLAADVQWGQAASLSGGRIGPAMLVWEAVIGPVALVVALFVLLRLLGARAVVAGSAAGSVVVLGPLWTSTLTGRITQEIAPGLAVSVVVLVVAAVRRPPGLIRGALAGIAVAGVLLTHTYEVLFAAVLIVAAVVTVHGLRKRAAITVLVATSAAALLAVAPMLSTILGAGSERADTKASMAGDVGGAVRFWIVDLRRYVLFAFPSPSAGHVPLTQTAIQIGLWVTVPCLLGAPLCLAFGQLRWARPWLACWAVWTLIGIWTSSSDSGAAHAVAGLWYGVPERLRSMILPVYGVLTVAGAVAIGLCAQRLALLVRRRMLGRDVAAGGGRFARGSAYAAPAVAVAVVAALLVLAATPSARRPIAQDMSARTPHGPDYPATFRWLAQHTAPGHVVAYAQNIDMVTWSYVDDDVAYLFGMPPVTKAAGTEYDDRWAAWDWLVGRPGARPAGCSVRRFGVEYVVAADSRVPGFSVPYDAGELARSPRVDLVHRAGRIKVYRVNAAGAACAATG